MKYTLVTLVMVVVIFTVIGGAFAAAAKPAQAGFQPLIVLNPPDIPAELRLDLKDAHPCNDGVSFLAALIEATR